MFVHWHWKLFTANGFSCTFFDLAINQSPQGISCDVSDKSLRQLLTIDMDLYVSCSVHTLITAKLGVITSQFYGFLRLLEYEGSEYEEFYTFNFWQGNVMYISGHMQWKNQEWLHMLHS